MKRILFAEEMKAADQTQMDKGLPSMVLMERAAYSVVEEIKNRNIDTRKVLIVCGSGNNGGDGAAIARILLESGIKSDVCIVGDESRFSLQMKEQVNILRNIGFETMQDFSSRDYTLVIDSIFGIGLKREITGAFKEIIEKMNASSGYKVAVDIPSGIHTDSGRVMGCAFRSDLTVTFARGKAGLYLYPGASYAGDVCVKEIGIAVDDAFSIEEDKLYAVGENDLSLLPNRDESGNKGTFGKVLIIAGSKSMYGAAYLSASAALRCGVGMVKLLTHKENKQALQMMLPEALLSVYEDVIDEEAFIDDLIWADTVLIGPGLGKDACARELVRLFAVYNTKPAIVDADALNIIAEENYALADINAPLVITPHMGEMSRLNGSSIKDMKENPIAVAKEFALANKVVCVLKDARTVVAYPEGACFLNLSGCSALSTAGSGDVLAGIMAGIMTLGRKQPHSLVPLAVWIHGKLGERVSDASSSAFATASDLVKELKNVL